MTGAAHDFGSLQDVLARTNARENVLQSIDAEYAREFPDVVTSVKASTAGGVTRNLARSAGPVSDAYILGAEPVMLITGPGGSGKTTASVKKALVEAQRIWPGPDGVRRYVLGVWRQKYDNLWKATIPSWWSILRKDLPGSQWVGASPRAAMHVVRFEDRFGLVELTAHFRAFGDAADPADLKGNQFTDVYLNEMDTMPEELLVGLADRIGRDPPFEVIRRHGRIFGDGNAPDITNYVYRDFYESPPEGYRLYRQPGGRDPGAENIDVMGRGYYEHSAKINAHRPWWVRVMVDARPGYLRATDPVYPKWDDVRNMAPTTMQPVPDLPVIVGIDGGLTPAAAYMQELPSGQLRIYAEVQLERGGMRELATEMLALEARRFRNCDFHDVCDPSMIAGEETDDVGNTVPMEDSQVTEGSPRQRLQKYLGRDVTPAPTQDVTTRIDAIACKFDLAVDGGLPGLLLDPSCKGLRRGFNQTFHFRKVQGTNDRGSIAKTFDGHVHEGAQYGALACGTPAARKRKRDLRIERQKRIEQNRGAGRYNPLTRRRA